MRPTGAVAAGADPAAVAPAGATLLASLDAARRTALFMEETYYAWELDTTHSQPLSLGIMNCFGRWAQAPSLRLWWPLLKPLHSPPFARFLENTFGLAGLPRVAEAIGVEEADAADANELAAYSWQLGSPKGRVPADGYVTRFLAHRLPLMRDGEAGWSVQAALLRAFRDAEAGVLYWHADDFFVPAGLWGVGIGEDFLRRLRAAQSPGDAEHWVAIGRPAAGNAGAAKSAADRRRMYKAAGFSAAAAPPPRVPADERVDWLVRRLEA